MLNLLPAILLLLLQGPVVMQDGMVAGSWQNREVRLLLDSLGRLSEVPELAQAVAQLLRERKTSAALVNTTSETDNSKQELPEPRAELHAGFASSQRSRDGPAIHSL